MKKIAYVITQSEMGGAQKNIFLLCKYLKDHYDITVYSAPGGELIRELNSIGIKHIPVLDMVREINLLKDYKAYRFLLHEFITNRYDIVHCHSSKAGIIAREAASAAKIKNVIYTAHGFVFNEPMNKYKKNLYTFLEKFEATKTNTLICVDPNDVTIAKNLGMKCKNSIEYIPNGIEFDEPSNPNFISGSTNGKFIFGFVANFYETKGHRYLIKAFNELVNSGIKDIELVLIGSGALEDEMKLLSQNNNSIKFLGFKKNGSELMKSFDCFVMSSVKEGFPFVILEAIKNTIPIISTEVGAVRNILKDGELGYLVNAADWSELMNSMLYVYNNYHEAKTKAVKAYDYCLEKYSIKNMIKLTINAYECI